MDNQKHEAIKRSALLAAAMAIAAVQAFAALEWPLEKLTVAAYYMEKQLCTPRHIREMRECGIDMLIPCRNGEKETLDLLAENGIAGIARGVVPGCGWAIDRGVPLARRRDIGLYAEWAADFVDHPAIKGIDLGDEPGAGDFQYLGLAAQKTYELFPGKFIYMNLYPNYASVTQSGGEEIRSQLGTRTYAEYIDEYLKWMPLNYICYDFYYPSVTTNARVRIMRQFYSNLETVADAGLNTGRRMCNILLVGSSEKNPVYTSENELRYQAYASMAFGSSLLGWACYGGGWWINHVVDKKGNNSEQYAKLKRVNAEIHRIAPLYDTLRRVGTHFVGFEASSNLAWLAQCSKKDKPRLDAGVFHDVAAETSEPILIGEFVGRTPGDALHALFIVGAGDPFDENPRRFAVRMKTSLPVVAYGKDGQLETSVADDGSLRIPLAPNEFALVMTKASAKDALPRLSASEAAAYRAMPYNDDAETAIVETCPNLRGKLAGLKDELAKYRFVASHVVGLMGEKLKTATKKGIKSPLVFSNGYFCGMRTEDGVPMTVFDLVSRGETDRKRAVCVVVESDPDDAKRRASRPLRFVPAGEVSVRYANGGADSVRAVPEGGDRSHGYGSISQKWFPLRNDIPALVVIDTSK